MDYTLVRKNVKNINLRVRADGSVTVSAPKRVPKKEIDAFVASREDWIIAAKERVKHSRMPDAMHTDQEALAMLLPVAERMLALAPFLKKMPEIKLRHMTSCWGVCHPKKRYITLNKALCDKPVEAIEYVILHEYVHFINPNHGKEFHQMMAHLMPDYKERKKLL